MNHLRKPIILLLVVSILGISPCVKAQTAMFDGKPTFAEGTALGYFVWREGDAWHVRWTTKGKMRQFSGTVVSEGGKLKSFKRIDVESERRVLYPGRAPQVVYGPRGRPHVRGGRAPVVIERTQDKIEKDGDHKIVFLARTNDDIDGFDFKVDDKAISLTFVLDIDGMKRPQLVETGKNNQKAESLPLRVRLK